MDSLRSKKSKISADLPEASQTSNGLDATVYSLNGKKSGTVSLPEYIFGLNWNADLVKQVADSLLSSKRKNVAHTKDRSDVRGGGKKPWRQKGTGRARHGSIRSPIWVGGGVTGGPRNEKNFERKVSKKMRTKALYTILSRKLKDGEVLFIDSIVLNEPKTMEAVKALESLSSIKGFEKLFLKKNNAAAIALSGKYKETERAFNNLGNVEIFEARNLNPLSLLEYKYLVIENPLKALAVLPGATKLNHE
ncbi:MAG: 50S ribosomal protein L4 [Candidatus Zambryskibacteria bacterium CG_4_9_14_3_um_filter_42_9]|uniref:Large ribosomal subunit protein uL4 n=1 Tax=Candidatus Zambryskibacteria bacterium CG22_combo_CG10-13_8_21_14_all_42_17 TaxID=1975118 RepID=A0A2H0BDH4_9BACT|nr:MAG: 50S ribosomal protein L4 [Candidatus Zambryskibacteria bacterium CG22_combo_CG10-13_8_21_14_all_42_17]PJA36755.1 MAG: 50S ribosomal protein L4 [Candidatus Zambryskibacteria bacterium CG_4_9_14_3_um_filter_42_9]